MPKIHHAIGMFDSGCGGLTVMRKIAERLPNEDIIYFGDTARVPYGEKSRETIIRYSIENAIFLMEQNIKILVIACNTAASYSVEKLRRIFNIPIIGVIEPGADKAVRVTRKGCIAVLGTKGTIQSGAYQNAILSRCPEAQITTIACPLFVPLVEERFTHHPAARLIVREYLAPLKNKNVDTLLLGCTHYPLMMDLIREEIGDEVAIVDSASTCAERVYETLCAAEMFSGVATGRHRFFVSDDPEKFQRIGCEFFGSSVENVSAIPSVSLI